ncbi:acetolactate synthase, large subunit, biosynthetic type [Candidatus Micrarchaeota archaeon CG08_land_8_20_14_0_20_49_17]|nr:MAG: acetolactate synthase, large subunit, biosynthetic type [Candidatus Micrarchaeota archaeon CG1_02_49_24]PIU09830.1 MAG: acetolactate synthase, large subunit, biosynthetic type [Candidatus Micrarchaeota archaeon CG08_land_8_20_14_0_20_49_17]PIZ92650.1 MAG: acetolactate synthase, large subunit, biosynthetic type [Candidatus Micrarchaeota archaeon CG_4_10_14_0_2_um_filter_49_7]HII53377.1 biosynthetic-type acetolactate synthase large subunit [Candidatus Micrarchaeota archaeon]
MKISGGKAVLEAVKREGIGHMFGFPGGAVLPFYDEIAAETGLVHILTRHEQGAGHAAEGYARASGKTGVCVSTSGPGGTNLTTPVADAFLDSIPILAITGQVVTDLIGNDAFQEADLFGIMMPITKHNFKVLDANELPHILKMAFKLTHTGRPGPVHIDLPKDVQSAIIDFNYPDDIVIPGYQPNLRGHPNQIKRAAEMLVNAERPLLLGGGGLISSSAHQEFTALAEMLACPAVTTLMAKGAMDENHPLHLGQPGMHGRQVANYAIQNADLILAVGCRFDDRITGKVQTFAPHAKIIHIDIDTAELGKNVAATLPIVGDARLVLQDLLAMLKKLNAKAADTEWKKRVHAIKEACNCNYAYEETPIRPERILYELGLCAPKNSIFVTEVGQHQMFAMHFIKVDGPRKYISSGGLGTMGFGLPAAIGAKAARPDATVIDISGDGSLLMVNQEMATAVESNLPVVITVFNNSWLGMVRQWQKMFFGKRYSGTHLGQSPDFVKLAEAYGGEGVRIEKPGEIKEGFERAFKANHLFLLEIDIDPEWDCLPMVPPGGSNSGMIPSKACTNVVKKMHEYKY